jgi:phosphoribosyl 1,2-cyclic phosphate phosphodiesterase
MLDLSEVHGTIEVTSRYGEPGALRVQPVPAFHGDLPILGFRFDSFAYMTDVSRLPEESYDLLEGLDTLVLSALRPKPHPTHFSIDEAIEASRRIGAENTYFIHMTHNILHRRDDAALPEGVQLAYDGLVLEVGA